MRFSCKLHRGKLGFSVTLFSGTCFAITFGLGCCPVILYTHNVAIERISEEHLLQLPS